MPELKALVSREWSILRRTALGGLLLISLGVAFLFVMCRTPDRYRLLADPNLLRMIMLPGPLLLGLLLSYWSFAQEMRAGTWDGLLLLPCSRRLVLLAKLGVGLSALVVATTIPMVALRAVLAALPATGGPILTTTELLQHSLLGRGLVLGLVGHLSGASAAFLARDHRGAFLVPLAAPVLGLLALHAPSRPEPLYITLCILSVVAVVWLGHLVAAMDRHGRPPSGRFLAARALLPMPVTLVALHLVGLLAHDLYLERRVEPQEEAEGPSAYFHGIGVNGHIVRARHSRGMISMYGMKNIEQEREPVDRRWTPDYSGRHVQLFLQKHVHTFLAYDISSGQFLGCVGANGHHATGCEPFDSPPRVLQDGDDAFVLTRAAVFEYDDETRQLLEIHRGPVRAFGNLAVGEGDGLAVQSGDDLLLWGEEPAAPDQETGEGGDEPAKDQPAKDQPAEDQPAKDQPPRDVFSAKPMVCPGATAFGALTGVAARDSFVALSTVDPASGRETLTVCRNGAVSEQKTLPAEDPPEQRPASEMATVRAVLLGPLVSEGARLLGVSWSRYDGATEFEGSRVATSIVALVGAVVLTGLLHLRRRRDRARGVVLSAACALLLGPAYVVAYLLMGWRRSWSVTLGA